MNGISVQEALVILDKFGVTLLAGEKGLSNIITEVSVQEIVIHAKQIKQWLIGGELILSTLHAYKKSQETRELIEYLAAGKAAAILVHPGNRGNMVLDESMLDTANRLGLPVLTVPRSVAYVKIITTIYSYILNQQLVQLKKSEEINKRLTSILVSGGDTKEIINALAALLKKPVLLLDENDQRVAQCEYLPIGNKLMESYATRPAVGLSRSALYNQDKNKLFICDYNMDGVKYRQIIYRLFLTGDYFGAIVIWSELNHIDMDVDKQTDLDGLYHAATALTLLALQNKAAIEAEEKRISSFYDDLLNHRFESEDSIFIRAKSLDIASNCHYQVVIVDIDSFEQYCLVNAHKGEEYFQNIKTRLSRVVKTAFTLLNEKSKLVSVSDSFVVFLEISPKLAAGFLINKLQAIADYIHREMENKFENLSVTIGIGMVETNLLQLSKSFAEAKKAIEIGRKVYKNNNIYYYEQMGIYSLLLADSINELKESYVATLADLTQKKKLNEMVLDTLEAYFDCNESISATAKLLYIHPNTVKYRMSKVMEAFGEDFELNKAKKLHIHVTLKMRKLL